MTNITDEHMMQMMGSTRTYTAVILSAGPNISSPDAKKIIWEHGRRNFALRADGLLSIVCPVLESNDVKGIGISNADINETKKIMDEDPGVIAGIFVYGLYNCRSFPGDSLAK